MRMLNTKSTVNKTSKSLLAKCMATEDIRVEHSKNAETAAFDIKNRCLVLPIWKDMSHSMYDMLVAHEVSHALNTPFEEWDKALDTVSNKGAFKQICNVVEDARIERLIKTRYAGVRKDFARAYAELHNTDLFELKGKNLADLNLIDRLNIEFKLGLFGLVQVPFSADEKQFVTRMANTETFADVIELAKDLLDDWKADQDQNDQQESGQGEQSEQGEGSENGQSSSSGDSDGDKDGSSSDTSESTDGVGDDAETQSGDGSDENGSPMDTPNLDDIQGNGNKDQDSESGEGEAGEGSEQDGLEYDDYSNNGGGVPSETQEAFEQGMKDLVNNNATDLQYHTLPESMNLDNIIFDYKDVFGVFEAYGKSRTEQSDYRSESFRENYNKNLEDTKKFVSGKKAVVNHMVSQFQMKQSADEDRRTSISKSGVLDTTAMINYKWSEDVFLNNEVIRDGKNHGMVFFLDWSGSMRDILKDTVEQLLILTEFCNKVNIPFEVYAFSDRTEILPEECYSRYNDETQERTHPQYNTKEGASNPLQPHDFTLINFVSSRMNKKEYKTAIANLYGMMTNNNYLTPPKFTLGCTPLNESIVTALDIVPAFQESTGVQIVNAVFLTDGQGHSMFRSGYRTTAVLHDPVTRKDYTPSENGWHGETNAYLEVLKDRTDCNIIGIFLTTTKSVSSYRYSYLEEDDISGATKTWKTSNYAVASPSKTSYDECYIIKGNIGSDESAMDALGEDASYTQIRNAFKKSANGNKTDKIIATKMIEVFASTLQR